MNKRIIAIMLLLIMCVSVGCQKLPPVKNEQVELNPQSDAARTEKMTVQLYYGNAEQQYLVSESREINAAANDPLETSVLKELIKGPQITGGEYNYLINKDTEVVNVSSGSGVLTVTLSKEFLEWPATVSEAEQRQLAVYSIVNTLVEATGYAQIQLMVDRDSNGVGQRIKIEEVGFWGETTDSSSGILGVLERNGELVLTPGNTIKYIFDAMLKKNYAEVYPFIAYNDTYGTTKTDQANFLAQLKESTLTLEGYTIREIIVSNNGQSAVVMVDYTLRFATDDASTKTNVPTYLIKENGIWKQQYSAFANIFLNAGV